MQIELSWVVAIVGCLVGLAGWTRTRDKDKSGDVRQLTTIEMKLDTILQRLEKNDTRVDFLSCEIQAVKNRVTILETKGE